MRRKDFETAHQHIEQALALGLLGHVADIGREHRAIGRLDMSGKDGERGGKFVAQLRERNAGLSGDVGKPDRLEALVGQKRQKGRDDFLAIGGRSCRSGGARRARRSGADLRAGLRAMSELLHERRHV